MTHSRPSTGNGRSNHSRLARLRPGATWQSSRSQPHGDGQTNRGGVLHALRHVLSGHYRLYHCSVCGIPFQIDGPTRKDTATLNKAGWTRWDKKWRCPTHRKDRTGSDQWIWNVTP